MAIAQMTSALGHVLVSRTSPPWIHPLNPTLLALLRPSTEDAWRYRRPPTTTLWSLSCLGQSSVELSPTFVSSCLQIMEEVIKYRWGALPDEQREGIKTYISNLIIKLSTDDGSFRRERTFLNKMNMILVQILKQVCRSPTRAHLQTPILRRGELPRG